MRSNDGAVDSEERFWVATMNDPSVKQPADQGVVSRLDNDGSLHRIIESGPIIPNSISWNEKNDTMFLTDSPKTTYWLSTSTWRVAAFLTNECSSITRRLLISMGMLETSRIVSGTPATPARRSSASHQMVGSLERSHGTLLVLHLLAQNSSSPVRKRKSQTNTLTGRSMVAISSEWTSASEDVLG